MADVFALGLDFGTASVRAVVARVSDGAEFGSASAPYPSGENGVIVSRKDPQLARQHPGDYLPALESAARRALDQAEGRSAFARARVAGIGVDTTGSTPLPLDRDLQPLAALPRFQAQEAALAWLWKDHTSAGHARRLNQAASGLPYLSRCGGAYQAEWFWAKVWNALEHAPDVAGAAYTWLELADWIPASLCGRRRAEDLPIGVCAAGHKGLYSRDWGGWPARDFLESLHPGLARLRDRLPAQALVAGTPAGTLSPDWQRRLQLPPAAVSVGALDAHLGAVGAGVGPGTLVKILGTSTCDILVSGDAPVPRDLPGVSGVVEGSVLPGRTGIEAGQSAVGDLFDWFARVVLRAGDHDALSAAAAALRPGQSGLLALDWNNGNRCVLADPELSGLLVGQTLHSSAAEIYRALIEATAFGARRILDQVTRYGIPVERVVACGGIARKNAFLMQLYADVLGRPMEAAGSGEACALGAAICGAAAAGLGSVEDLQRRMVPPPGRRYEPDAAAHARYDPLYRLYLRLHDDEDLRGLMKELLSIRRTS
ncbi:MAG: ribulokinase [Planctomycetota bacterium]|nr:MAG: ribulokinase [Planctomycetota bacterium]